MALKIKKTVWLGHGQTFAPGKEKELFAILKTKKDRQPLIDRGILVEVEDPVAPDPEPEEEKKDTSGAPWKDKK
jgi:hypothetical protein